MNRKKLPLTKREEDIFAYILGYIVDNEYSPTRQEIADQFGITPMGAQKFVKVLEAKGKVKILKKKNGLIKRNITIVENKL